MERFFVGQRINLMLGREGRFEETEDATPLFEVEITDKSNLQPLYFHGNINDLRSQPFDEVCDVTDLTTNHRSLLEDADRISVVSGLAIFFEKHWIGCKPIHIELFKGDEKLFCYPPEVESYIRHLFNSKSEVTHETKETEEKHEGTKTDNLRKTAAHVEQDNRGNIKNNDTLIKESSVEGTKQIDVKAELSAGDSYEVYPSSASSENQNIGIAKVSSEGTYDRVQYVQAGSQARDFFFTGTSKDNNDSSFKIRYNSQTGKGEYSLNIDIANLRAMNLAFRSSVINIISNGTSLSEAHGYKEVKAGRVHFCKTEKVWTIDNKLTIQLY